MSHNSIISITSNNNNIQDIHNNNNNSCLRPTRSHRSVRCLRPRHGPISVHRRAPDPATHHPAMAHSIMDTIWPRDSCSTRGITKIHWHSSNRPYLRNICVINQVQNTNYLSRTLSVSSFTSYMDIIERNQILYPLIHACIVHIEILYSITLHYVVSSFSIFIATVKPLITWDFLNANTKCSMTPKYG